MSISMEWARTHNGKLISAAVIARATCDRTNLGLVEFQVLTSRRDKANSGAVLFAVVGPTSNKRMSKKIEPGELRAIPVLRATGRLPMNKTAEIVVTVGVAVAALSGTASAQNSPGIAAIDNSLRGAVERKD